MDYSYRGMVQVRQNHRAHDMAESQSLLLELGSSEPTLQQCFKIIESTCLSQGIYCQINKTECSERFQRHLDLYYIPFLKDALRAMVIFGFVPWRLRRVKSGDQVPEVMPSGTFEWHTELGPTQENRRTYDRRKRAPVRGIDDDSRLVTYRVTPTIGDVKEEDIHVYIHTNPSYNVSNNSILSATVPSPLAHVLTDYKNLRNAQIRRSYADAWNTTAHMITTFRPAVKVQDDPDAALMDFQDPSNFDPPLLGKNYFPNYMARNWFERDMLIKRQMDRPGTAHRPQVYTLPRDHDLASQVMLSPCEDLEFLLDKFRRDITSITGIPFEMVVGRNGGLADTAKKTMASGRLFSTNMHEFCRHCQYLLTNVYCYIYKVNPESVHFRLTPMPRLEVESVEDFKVLYEIGALTPDMSLELSKILLGNAAKPFKKPTQPSNEGESDDEGNFKKKSKQGSAGDDLILSQPKGDKK